MCQVSIVVSQGLNTFNNLISTSSSFVVLKENPRVDSTYISSYGQAFTSIASFSTNFLAEIVQLSERLGIKKPCLLQAQTLQSGFSK